MRIAFYHYYWPCCLKNKNTIFKNKISEYLVIYNIIKSLEKRGYQIIRYSKVPPSSYSSDKLIFIFRNGIFKILDLINFIINPPDVLGIVSKSVYNSKSLIPLIRLICRIRRVKFLIFLGHDESKTSLRILKNVKPYKYKEDVFWNDSKNIDNRITKNESYRPLSKNEYIIVPSKTTKENCVKEGWPSSNIHILPHGCDSNYFKPARQKTRTNQKIKILFAGNGATRKGLPYLLKTHEYLQNKYSLELTILSHNVKNIKIPNVKVLEDINDLKLLKLYQSHDIFVLPSLLDGWGLTASEAMSCELPTIVSNKTGIVDIIKDNINGYAVEVKNSQALMERIEMLIKNKDLRAKIGSRARKTILDYSWDNIGSMFLNIID